MFNQQQRKKTMRFTLIALLVGAVSAAASADQNNLSNDKLKDNGFSRLEGNNAFKVGCRHIIRSESRSTVLHPAVLTNQEIGLSIQGNWHTVQAADKNRLNGPRGGKVTVWRKCDAI
jgi:hypothetical protein